MKVVDIVRGDERQVLTVSEAEFIGIQRRVECTKAVRHSKKIAAFCHGTPDFGIITRGACQTMANHIYDCEGDERFAEFKDLIAECAERGEEAFWRGYEKGELWDSQLCAKAQV